MSKNFIKLVLIILALNMFVKYKEINAASIKSEHKKWHENFLNEKSWENACGGEWKNTNLDISKSSRRSSSSSHLQYFPHYKALRDLKKAISLKYNDSKANSTAIDISDIKKWKKYRKSYKFLPRLKKNSTLSLHTWHRQMQTYVAGFSYLHHAQHFYDFQKYNQESNMSKILKDLKLSALYVLCEIEATINKTSVHRKRALKMTSPENMLEILSNFRTNIENFGEASNGVDEIDLKFVKFRFLHYLHSMRKIVKRKIVERTSISQSSSNSRSSSRSRSSFIDSSNINSKSYDSSFNSLFDEMSHSSSLGIKSHRQRHRKHHQH